MSTLVRFLILIGEFLILFSYEFVHIRKELKKRKKWKKDVNNGLKRIEELKNEFALYKPKDYRLFAIISYSVLNIIIMLLPLLFFNQEIFLSYNKLIVWGGIIVFFVFFHLSLTNNKNLILYLGVSLAASSLVSCFFIPIFLNFSEVLDIKTTYYQIEQVNSIFIYYNKINSKSYAKNYIIYYTDENGEEKEEIIEGSNVITFEYSETVDIKKCNTTYTKINRELKYPEEYTQEDLKYYIFVPKKMVHDLTKK